MPLQEPMHVNYEQGEETANIKAMLEPDTAQKQGMFPERLLSQFLPWQR